MNDAFLATTALDQFWDKNLPLIFLNEGARRFSSRHVWEKLQYADLGFDWPQPIERESERFRLIADSEKILRLLTSTLNTFHGCNHSVRYWRIMLSAWIDQYLTAVYERHAGLVFATSRYPNIKLTGPASNAFGIPSDSHEFALWVREDSFNLLLYARVANELGLSVEALNSPLPPLTQRLRARGRFATLRAFLNRIMHSGSRNRKLLMRESYFDTAAMLRLALLSKGKILPIHPHFDHRTILPNPSLRGGLANRVSQPGTGRLDLAIRLIPHYLPVCFLEGYCALHERSATMYPSNPRAIFTVNSLYYDEPFKHWAAESANAGTLLIGGQHGGTIGVVRNLPSVEFELTVTDRYYSWGHNETWQEQVACPMPATKFMSLKRTNRDTCASSGPILFGASNASRFVHLMIPSCTPVGFSQYLEWQIRFFFSCGSDLRQRLRYRSHEAELGWNVTERLLSKFPDVEIDSPSAPFRASLGQCAIFVCDYIGTIYAESMAAGVPTLLFWDPKKNPLTPQATGCFDELRRVGILHDTPESAARELRLADGDFDKWWQIPDRQRAVQTFVRLFARRSDSAVREWYDEFERALAD